MLLTFSRNAFLGFFVVNALFLLWKFNAKKLALARARRLGIAAMLAPEAVYRRITYGFERGRERRVAPAASTASGSRCCPRPLKSPLWGNGLGSIMWSAPDDRTAR